MATTCDLMDGKYSEYPCMTDHDEIVIDEFLLLCTTHVCRTFAADPTPTPTLRAVAKGGGG